MMLQNCAHHTPSQIYSQRLGTTFPDPQIKSSFSPFNYSLTQLYLREPSHRLLFSKQLCCITPTPSATSANMHFSTLALLSALSLTSAVSLNGHPHAEAGIYSRGASDNIQTLSTRDACSQAGICGRGLVDVRGLQYKRGLSARDLIDIKRRALIDIKKREMSINGKPAISGGTSFRSSQTTSTTTETGPNFLGIPPKGPVNAQRKKHGGKKPQQPIPNGKPKTTVKSWDNGNSRGTSKTTSSSSTTPGGFVDWLVR